MSYAVSLQKRIQQLKKAQADLPDVLYKAQKGAAMRAVETATEKTPPTMNNLRGTNTRTGEMKQHWATDSKIEPQGGGLSGGSYYRSVLANNREYASYVDKGHRMDKHFVPGLYVNNSGVLEYDPAVRDYVGIVVGTKTSYIKGKFIVDQAVETYKKTLETEFDKEIQRLTK